MRRVVAAGCWTMVAVFPLAAQQGAPGGSADRAESLRVAGRPWHAAEAMLAAAAREGRPNAVFIVEGAKAELHARRYDRAKSLLVGQPWLADYENGEALAVLAEAEARLGADSAAARHFTAAAERATGVRAALLRVRAGVSFEAAQLPDSAARSYAAARAGGSGLPAIDAWLRLRQARVSRDTTSAGQLLAGLPPLVARAAPAAMAAARLVAGDTAGALTAFEQLGQGFVAARLALARGDSARARAALYDVMARSPESDEAAAAVGVATTALPPLVPAERIALARAMRPHGAAADALRQVERAVAAGDSSAGTLLLLGELRVTAGRYRDAARAYLAAARDSTVRALAVYRRARVLVRLNDPGALLALSGFADTYPADTAAPTALFLLGDQLADGDDGPAAARWFGELIARYPADPRASLARFRLAARATERGALDSAAALYQAEIATAGAQRTAARFWLGMLLKRLGNPAGAAELWRALAREDSTGYYGQRARRETDLPPLTITASEFPAPPAAVSAALGRIDTLVLAGLDTEARSEVRAVLATPPTDPDVLLAWSAELGARGFGPAAVRLAWQAALAAPGDPRVLRAIWLWPNRAAVEAEAQEFAVDPYLLVAIVRQESVFDQEALSRAGARGLAQLLPGTAALTARGLDVTFYPDWITVPDLNLHLGAAHLAELLRRFGGRVEAAVAAYNAGPRPVERWRQRPGAQDPDQFIEQIPYQETRGYVRSVLRNRDLYRALYPAPTN